MADRADHGDDVIPREFDYAVRNQVVYNQNGVRILSTPVEHYGVPGPVALRLEWNDLVFTYSGKIPNLALKPTLAKPQQLHCSCNGKASSFTYSGNKQPPS